MRPTDLARQALLYKQTQIMRELEVLRLRRRELGEQPSAPEATGDAGRIGLEVAAIVVTMRSRRRELQMIADREMELVAEIRKLTARSERLVRLRILERLTDRDEGRQIQRSAKDA